jgi:hypothetical protein
MVPFVSPSIVFTRAVIRSNAAGWNACSSMLAARF